MPVNFFQNLQEGKPQTIVVYGTSLTHTAEWPNALRTYFDRHYPGLVTVINSAMSGQHSDWGLAQLQERVLAKKPDLVLVEFSINDAATKHNLSLEQSRDNLDRIVRTLHEANPQVDVILQTMNTAWDRPNDPQGKKSASDRPNLEAYYDVYRRYARENDLPLLDHYQHWRRLQMENEEQFQRWLPDGTHPIPEASLAVTWSALEALLEQARSAA